METSGSQICESTGTTLRTESNSMEIVEQKRSLPSYVLITPARNEQAYIQKTIDSVASQTIPPIRWIIVNDGSTDSTGAVAKQFSAGHDWIEVIDRPVRQERDFAAKVHAFNVGLERLKDINYQIVGCLDADISFEPDHFEFLLGKFAGDPRLGVAGTVFKEEGGYSSDRDSFEGQSHVSGQCQIFRRECFEEIGGYFANKGGGIDWIAVTTARMRGWTTRSFRERYFFHHRHLGTAERSAYAAAFAYGYKDYCMGSHPVWELLRVVYRMGKKPFLIEGFGLGFGYAWAILKRAKHPISKELMKFYRREQMEKLGGIVKSIVTFKKVDKFKVVSQ